MSKFEKIPTVLSERKEWLDFLYQHPVVQDYEKPYFHLDIVPAYVNPETRMIDDDASKNTHFEVWIEGGPPYDMSKSDDGMGGCIWPTPEEGWNEQNRYMKSHDTDLDCGGDTLEEALLNFVARLKYYYNDDGTSKTGEDL